MEKRIVECVPNFSEGRDKAVIRQITSAIESSGGVKLLDVDPGEATNRTVVTFVGSPEAVIEAAFAGGEEGCRADRHAPSQGGTPAHGATDVLPLIPICGITLAECAELARKLAERIAAELHVPTYCYEAAAFTPERRNLAVCRAGEYEALPRNWRTRRRPRFRGAAVRRRGSPHGRHDRRCARFPDRREFQPQYHLHAPRQRHCVRRARKGRPVREGNPVTGKVVKDAAGNPVMQPGTLPATKAIGWFIEEYGIAQVSMNITDIATTPPTWPSTRCAARPTPAACASRAPKSSGSSPNVRSSRPGNISCANNAVRRVSPSRRSSVSPSGRWGWMTSNLSTPPRK